MLYEFVRESNQKHLLIFIRASHQARLDTRSFYRMDYGEEEVAHMPKLVRCWSMLGHRITWSNVNDASLCCLRRSRSMFVSEHCPREGGPARAGGQKWPRNVCCAKDEGDHQTVEEISLDDQTRPLL